MPQCLICHTEYKSQQNNKSCLNCTWPLSTSPEYPIYQEWAKNFGENFSITKNKPSEESELRESDNKEMTFKDNLKPDIAKQPDNNLEEKLSHIFSEILSTVKYMKNNKDRIDNKIDRIDNKIDRIDNKIDRIDNKIDRIDNKIDRIIQDLAELKIDEKQISESVLLSNSVTPNQLAISSSCLESGLEKIITDYNDNSIDNSCLTEVTITEESVNDLRSDKNKKIIFKADKKGTYCIFDYSDSIYLLINKYIKINKHNKDYIKEIFDCSNEKENQDYNNFKLLKPALVLKLNQEEELFELEEKGILEFI